MFTVLAGVATAAAIIFLLLKLPLRRLLAFDAVLDVAITLGLVFVLAGTFSGMVVAAIAGCLVSMFLFAAKRVIGYERPYLTRRGLQWQSIQPRRSHA